MVILNISQIKEKVKGKRKERTKWKGMNYTSVFLSNVPESAQDHGMLWQFGRSRQIVSQNQG
jgi:hypothetical protein